MLCAAVVSLRLHRTENADVVRHILDNVFNIGVACHSLAPNEWLMIGPREQVFDTRDQLAQALLDQAALVTDITHGYTIFHLGKAGADAALSAYCPVDLSPFAFPVGSVVRTLLAETVIVIIRLEDQGPDRCFRLIVDQTRSLYVARLIGRVRQTIGALD